MRTTKQAAAALLLAFIIAVSPVALLAAPHNAPAPIQQRLAYETWEALLASLREVTLTPGAMAYALYDFDYLVEKILEVSPTQNIIYRRYGITAADYFNEWRNVIADNQPMVSFLSVLEPGRWDAPPKDDLSIAADYLFSVLYFISIDLGGLGHLSVQWDLVEHIAYGLAYWDHNFFEMTDEDWDYWATLGYDRDVLEPIILANDQFSRLHHSIFNTPSVLWFYDIDPAQFDFTATPGEVIGFRDPYNITALSLEAGFLAYVRIENFSNNVIMDSQTLFPFFEAVQDYEHLIIDLRGNPGGWINYFPANVLSMLINENISFYYYELFVASDRTAGFFEHPLSMMGGDLYGIFPIEDFVESRNMRHFSADDKALLDYAMVWVVEYSPAQENIPFGGEIWLLVDGESMSASETAASIAINTDFATVVGDPTAGVTGVLYTFAALPNTGILFRIDLGYTVDRDGRSVEEYGVIPHILTTDGMDAFDTVIDVILTELLLEAYFNFLIESLAGPQQVVIPPPPPAAPKDDGFIALRAAANARGYTVAWDGENNAAHVIDADGSIRVVPVSVSGTINDGGTVFVTIQYAQEIFAGSAKPASPLVGRWAWDQGSTYVYTFNADGTGERGVPGIIEYFTWRTEDNRLYIDLTGELSAFVLRNERWTFVIKDSVLTITSRQVDDMVFSYRYLP